MRENEIERRLAVSVKEMGGMAVKFVSPGLDGVPDRKRTSGRSQQNRRNYHN